jgi:hypothetical protein
MKNYILKIRFAGDDERTEYIPFEAADDNDAAQRADAAVKAQVGTVAHAEWMSLGESAGEVVIAKPITERVKTLEDAIRELGEDNPLVQAYKTAEFNTSGNADDVKDVIAYLKLRLIVKALNEGWEPNHLDGDEYRYIPWFRVSRRAVYVGGNAVRGARAGLVFVFNFDPVRPHMDYAIPVSRGCDHEVLFTTDDACYGGFDNIGHGPYSACIPGMSGPTLMLGLPPRTAMVLRPAE